MREIYWSFLQGRVYIGRVLLFRTVDMSFNSEVAVYTKRRLRTFKSAAATMCPFLLRVSAYISSVKCLLGIYKGKVIDN